MNPLENELHYPLGTALPAFGAALPVAPGVQWIRMGLPFALDHINLWLLRDEIDGRPGWSVVDCGISNAATRTHWEQLFASALDGLPILRVIVTHMHPDHLGLAHWLCERWQVRLWISATDHAMARANIEVATGYGGDAAAAFFASHGLLDPESVAKIRARSGYYRQLVPALPRQYRRLLDGDVLHIGGQPWHCISGYGHTPEHIALHCPQRRLLIGGDMLLPRISTNVSVFELEPEANALKQYLDSIDKFLPLEAQTLTLPAHGRPFIGLQARIAQLHAHHRQRLAAVLAACTAKPCHAAELLPLLFPRALDLHQITFAMGESIAHLHWLWFAGQLQRSQGADGVYRFHAHSRT